MTCRYGHKRVALLFTLVQATAAARVIEWPQKLTATAEQKGRVSSANDKSTREVSYANK
jgi:hypothetical protein